MDVEGPEGEMDVKGPGGEMDVEGPGGEMAIEGPKGRSHRERSGCEGQYTGIKMTNSTSRKCMG